MEQKKFDSQRRLSGILKKKSSEHVHTEAEHVHFDEQVIAEHDLDRGTRMKIDEPKTPYNDEPFDEATGADQEQEDVVMQEESSYQVPVVEDLEIKKHLEEAERNKQLNAQLQKEQQNLNAFHSQLQQKLDSTQAAIDEEERKHEEFKKKRKEHYKNEFNPAMLLKAKSVTEDDEEEEEGKGV